jgi:2-keto-4-pentenoate hydratase
MTLTISALRAAAGPLIAAAYAVQRLLTEDSLARGRRIDGHKIGLTCAALRSPRRVIALSV